MNCDDYELCSKCKKLFLKAETQCFECSQPLVGWLVIIEGKGKGRDIQIFSGKNSIGRDKSNTICIDFGDNTIGRTKHAFVLFDKKNGLFFFMSGTSINLSYLNSEAIYSPMKISNGDIIEVGQTKLKFVSLCDTNFQWSSKNML